MVTAQYLFHPKWYRAQTPDARPSILNHLPNVRRQSIKSMNLRFYRFHPTTENALGCRMKTEILPSPGQSALSFENLPFVLSLATDADRDAIYRLRHEVYARELGQHAATPAGSLRDALDDWNIYLVAKFADQIAGFISLTP